MLATTVSMTHPTNKQINTQPNKCICTKSSGCGLICEERLFVNTHESHTEAFEVLELETEVINRCRSSCLLWSHAGSSAFVPINFIF